MYTVFGTLKPYRETLKLNTPDEWWRLGVCLVIGSEGVGGECDGLGHEIWDDAACRQYLANAKGLTLLDK